MILSLVLFVIATFFLVACLKARSMMLALICIAFYAACYASIFLPNGVD